MGSLGGKVTPALSFSLSASLALEAFIERRSQTKKNGVAAAKADPIVIPAMAPGDNCGPLGFTRAYLRVNTVSVMTLTCEPLAVVAGR